MPSTDRKSQFYFGLTSWCDTVVGYTAVSRLHRGESKSRHLPAGAATASETTLRWTKQKTSDNWKAKNWGEKQTQKPIAQKIKQADSEERQPKTNKRRQYFLVDISFARLSAVGCLSAWYTPFPAISHFLFCRACTMISCTLTLCMWYHYRGFPSGRLFLSLLRTRAGLQQIS